MAARPGLRVAVYFGRGLGAQKAARSLAQAEGQCRFIAGNQTAPKAAEASPNAGPAWTRGKDLQRTGCPHRSRCTLAGDHLNFEVARSRPVRIQTHTVKYCFTTLSFKFAMGPSAAMPPRSIT